MPPNAKIAQARFGGEQRGPLASALENKHHRPAVAHSAEKKCPPSEPLQPEKPISKLMIGRLLQNNLKRSIITDYHPTHVLPDYQC